MSASTKIIQAAAGSGGAGGATILYAGTTISDRVVAIDISDPANMSELGSISLGVAVTDLVVDVENEIAFAATGNLVAIDISDPANMSQISTYTGVDSGLAYSADYIALDAQNQVLYSTGSSDIVSVDVSDTSNMSYIADIEGDTDLFDANGIALDLVELDAYVPALAADRLVSFRITSGGAIYKRQALAGNALDGASGVALDTANGYLYLASNVADSISSVSISNPASMSVVDSLVDANFDGADAVALDLTNKIAYMVSERENGIASIDISDPTNLVQLQSLEGGTITDDPRDVVLDLFNNVAYVAAKADDQITAIDISNPSSMSVIGTFSSLNLDGVECLALNIVGLESHKNSYGV